jgi:predicted kinase
MATLHFICGKACSGKTTLARKLAAQHGAALFCEDEWLTLLEAEIANLADYVRHTKRLRAALAPHAIQLLRLGTSAVFDFAGNTPKDRAWVRSVFESAGANHMLHVITASDEHCRARHACVTRRSRRGSITAP